MITDPQDLLQIQNSKCFLKAIPTSMVTRISSSSREGHQDVPGGSLTSGRGSSA
jgi:hypothetical protein